MPKNKIICFNQDTKERKRFFKAASFAHPAKMVLGLQIYLIEHYTKPSDTILDPMAGSGTILIACTLGRNVVCVELEDKFVKMQQDNWQKVRSLGPMLGYQMGEAVLLKGDARNLAGLLADNILFSPPYSKTETMQDKDWFSNHRKDFGGGGISGEYAPSPSNIGNLPYGEISAVISSPPYEGSEPTCSESYKRSRTARGRDITKPSSQYDKYSGKADAVITSPPYEAQGFKCDENPENVLKREDKLREKFPMRPKTIPGRYGDNYENIGNLKSENYLEAMLQVYRQCYKVLKDKGLMVLVVKNFIRDKKIIRLDLDTVKICEKAGFKLLETLKRKLTSQSFWRIIYHQKYPDVPKIEYEDVLIFQRADDLI